MLQELNEIGQAYGLNSDFSQIDDLMDKFEQQKSEILVILQNFLKEETEQRFAGRLRAISNFVATVQKIREDFSKSFSLIRNLQENPREQFLSKLNRIGRQLELDIPFLIVDFESIVNSESFCKGIRELEVIKLHNHDFFQYLSRGTLSILIDLARSFNDPSNIKNLVEKHLNINDIERAQISGNFRALAFNQPPVDVRNLAQTFIQRLISLNIDNVLPSNILQKISSHLILPKRMLYRNV